MFQTGLLRFPEKEMTIMLELFQAGGPLMWPLLLCSIVSLSVILERFWFWSHLDLDKNVQATERFLNEMLKGAARMPQEGQEGVIGRMLAAGMACSKASCAKAMEVVALDALSKMRKGMPMLDTIITIAPMLGIIGTVLGIIASFDMLGQASVDDPKAVVSGIAQALITTAAGLSISVVTVFPFNYFNSRIEHAQDMMETYASRLEIARGDSNETMSEN